MTELVIRWGMSDKHPLIEILDRWNSRRAIYEDARAADPNLDMVAVHRWFQRKSVPSKYDAALLNGADRRGFGLHPMELVRARAVHADQSGHASRSRQDAGAK